jgi:hypothetical protein
VLQSPVPAPVVSRPTFARTQSVPSSQPERKVTRRPESAAPNGGVARNSRPTTPRKIAVPGVLVELIENEIVDKSPSVKWDDVGNMLECVIFLDLVQSIFVMANNC